MTSPSPRPGDSDLLSIGQLAELTGVSVSALRYYDELGLVPATERVGGRRRFDAEAANSTRFIKRAQRFGFSLEQIGEMLEGTNGASRHPWRSMVADRLDELRALRTELDVLIAGLEQVQLCGCHAPAQCVKLSHD